MAKPSAASLERLDPDVRGVLLYGPNRARAAEAAAGLVRRLMGETPDPFALTRLNEDEIRRDKSLLVDALAAQPLLGGGGRRMVRVRCEGEAASEAIVQAVAALQGGVRDPAFLLIEAGDLAARSRIRTAFEKGGPLLAVPFYEETPAEIARAAESMARDLAIELEPGALEGVLAALPGDRGVIRAELEKLALYGHDLGRAISKAEALALCGGEVEAELDEAIAFALHGDGVRAEEAFARADAAAVSAIKACERKLMRLAEAGALVAQGVAATATLTKLRPPVFWKEKDAFLQQLRVWREGRLAAALDLVWRAEIAAKQSGSAQDAVAFGLLRDIARLARS